MLLFGFEFEPMQTRVVSGEQSNHAKAQHSQDAPGVRSRGALTLVCWRTAANAENKKIVLTVSMLIARATPLIVNTGGLRLMYSGIA